MSLVTMKNLLLRAEEKNCAVGAFSVGNMEMVMGAVKAAEELRTPIILQIAEKRLQNSPLTLMGPMMVNAAKYADVDIAVHLDHGLTKRCVAEALSYDFTSVMLDRSLLPFEENVQQTKEIVLMASAELGVVGGNECDTEEHKITCTDPAMAKEFCERTGIDALAVAIGNAHGNYPVSPELRFDVLEEIHRTVDIPLVLHGGTGISDEQFRRALSLGIRKINIATASFDRLAQAAQSYCEGCSTPDYFTLSSEMVNGVYENVKKHIVVFNN